MGEKQASQKLRLMALSKILYNETDNEHILSHNEINQRLLSEGFEVPNRETFADDIKQLISFGVDILIEKIGRENYYRVASRMFELPELKLIVDCVQSSRFLTEKNSQDLIKRLVTYASQYEAQKLNRQIYVKGRTKSSNKQAFYNVDTIYKAIDVGKMISFHYYESDIKRIPGKKGNIIIKPEKRFRHDSMLYLVSPIALVSNNQNYYLIGCERDKPIKHFRVDRMMDVSLIEECAELNRYKSIKIPEYAELRFDMFDGYESKVYLSIEDNLYMVLEDRFGRHLKVGIADEKHLNLEVTVMVSNQFLSWILSLGNGIKITGPERVVADMKRLLDERIELYK